MKSILLTLLAAVVFLLPIDAAAEYWDQIVRDRTTIAAV